MNILGINAYHGDSSACLICDGELVSAAEEERFRRIKHWAGFPSKSIEYCLKEASLSLSDIDYVAINSDPRAHFLKKLRFILKGRPDFRSIVDRLSNQSKRLSTEQNLGIAFPNQIFRGEVEYVEHHIAHLSSAFYVSPFKHSIVVSVDGFGDFSSAAWGVGNGGSLAIDHQVFFPHSLGTFYQALTQFIGFPHYGDEYKVMGLAPYGQPAYMNQMHELLKLHENGSFSLNLDYFCHHNKKVEYNWNNGLPVVGQLFSEKMIDLLGPARCEGDELTQRHKDIAHSVQKMYENAFFNLINRLYEQHGLDTLCIAGGCGMNSVANGKVMRNSPYKHVYIQSAAGDAGGAIGAAYAVHHKKVKNANRNFIMDHAYFGPSYSNEDIYEILERSREALEMQGCAIELVDEENLLCQRTALAISEGKVIGWFQGRMEWGPRALGNRSILGDPRRADMKDILNLKIKRRESFRPFAPSILREDVLKWFEEEADVPFMMQVFQIREEKRAKIPAVTHVDGSGRLQTVTEITNPRYYRLISAFAKLTGVPIILNTSFNENEPVVCTPQEALDCFMRTKMDMLVLGNWVVCRA